MENKQKRYLKAYCKEKEFSNGGKVIKISILKADFMELEAKKGYVKLILARKKNPDANSTHYIYLDEYEYKNPNKEANNSTIEVPF